MISPARPVVLLALAVALSALCPQKGSAESTSSDICKSACFNGLKASLTPCEDQRVSDSEACVAEALEPFQVCFLTCVQSGWMSIYRLPGDRFLLIVIPRARHPPVPPPVVPRLHIATVPILEGVRISSGTFGSLESLSKYILAAYQSASDADNASLSGCGRQEGCVFPGPPRLVSAFPGAGPSFMPLGILGSNFASGAVPYFNGTPSVALFNWSLQNIPLIGSISVGVTIVPPAAPSGAGDVAVEYLGQRSNPFPFTKN